MRGNAQLAEAWKTAAGERIASRTKVLGLKSGVLEIGVANSALLNELASFHQLPLLKKMRDGYSEQSIRDLRFKLKSDLTETEQS